MTVNPQSVELDELVSAQCEGVLTDEQAARIEELVASNAELRRDYILYLHVHACAERDGKLAKDPLRRQARAADATDEPATSGEPTAEPLVVIHAPLPPGFVHTTVQGTVGYAFQSWSLAYLAAVVLLGIGLFIGSLIHHTSSSDNVATDSPPSAPPVREAKMEFVGRVTGLVDCQWADPRIEVSERECVPLGRKYALAAGFLEITYDSGAKVILQGPATYEVKSASGGYLSRGKLTAQVEKQEKTSGAKGERTANPTLSRRGIEPIASLAPGPSVLAPLPSPLFSVRTPTAVVTDLGTEFGVEVDQSGTTKSHVFRGKVEVRPVGVGGEVNDGTIPLGENESVTVKAGGGPVVRVTRAAGQSYAAGFTRQMPRRVRIKLFNTGIGLKEGDPDPHWQLVARSDYPHAKPQPAVVTAVAESAYLPNNPARWQWISTAGDSPALPSGLFTFRTTFELADAASESAVLGGRFLADNHVDAVRLNGHAVPVPEHGVGPPFDQFHSFIVRKGFVEGTNVLEIDVYNYAGMSGKGTPMALLVELDGFTLRGGHGPVASHPDASAPNDRKGTGR